MIPDAARKWRYVLSLRAYLLRQQIAKFLARLGRIALRLCAALFFVAVSLYALQYFGVVHLRAGASKMRLVWQDVRGKASPAGSSLVPIGASELPPSGGEGLAKEEPGPTAQTARDGNEERPQGRAKSGKPQPKRREFVRAKNFVTYDDGGFSAKVREHQDMPGGILRKFDAIPLEQRPARRAAQRTSAEAGAQGAHKAGARGDGAGRQGSPEGGKRSRVLGSSAPDLVVREGRFFDEGEVSRWRKSEDERLQREQFWIRMNRRALIAFAVCAAALLAVFFFSGAFKALLKMLRESEGTFNKNFDFRPLRKSSWKGTRK